MCKPQLASKQTCTGCMACVDSCVHVALSSYIGTDGHLYVAWNQDNCVKCGRCSLVCPIVNDFKYEVKDGKSKPYAAWANNRTIRKNSASGGVFAMMASHILEEGGVVVGAVMEGLEVKHCIVERLKDLEKLQGSKYQQGNLSRIYLQVKKILKAGRRVLFSGTPCQVGALYSFLSPNRYANQLITVDLICGGFPSLLPLQALIKNTQPTIVGIKSFRDKEHGWKSFGYKYHLVCFYENGEIADLGTKNIVLGAFGSHLTHRYSCFNCQFAYARRMSDITIADFWGEKRFPQEHNNGVSLIVVHSDNGTTLLNNSDVTYKSALWADFLYNNPRMIYAKNKYFRLYFLRKFMTFLFRKCSYTFLMQLYHGQKRSIVLLPYSGIEYMFYKINDIRQKQAIKRAVKIYDK